MNVVVAARDLLGELQLLEKIVSKKPTLPILANVFIQAHEGWLHLSATDLEIGLITACQATVSEAGVITLPAKKLVALAQTLPDTMLNISRDASGSVKFSAASFNSRLQSLPPQDFPTLPAVEGSSLALPRMVFRGLMVKVRPSIDDADTRYNIKGALLTLPEGKVAMVATDGKRLALAGGDRTGPGDEQILIPTKTLDQLIALTSSGDKDVEFTRTERHLFFQLDGRILISRRLEAQFPNYQRVIPKEPEHVVSVDRLSLMQVVERAILVSEIITLDIATDAVNVLSSSVDVGEGSETVPADYKGQPVSIKVRGSYLIDFLHAADNPTIRMSVASSNAPLLFSDGQTYVNVIMGVK